MPSTVYKGDLAEVTMGHETGIVLTKGAFGGLHWAATTGAGGAGVDSADTTRITFSGTSAGFFRNSGDLKYPIGLLVGSKLRFSSSATNYGDFDFTKGNIYTIVSNGVGADDVIDAASLKDIVITPALPGASGLAAEAGDEIYIDSLGTPTLDQGMAGSHTASASDERVLTDQFVGLAATVTLPETKVEVFRSHVVGIGRDVVVQEPQHIKNEGGSLETMMHSARWLYYALGNEAVKTPGAFAASNPDIATTGNAYAAAVAMGDTYIGFSNSAVTTNAAVGDYIVIIDAAAVLTPYDDEPAAGAALTKWSGAQTQFRSSIRNEMRRVIATDNTDDFKRIYVDGPFNFDHVAGCQVSRVAAHAGSTNGSPDFVVTNAGYGTITNRQSRALWSMWHLPSFSLETSMRTRDVGSYLTDELNTVAYSGNVPGSANDSKQLTRIYKGCKVKTWELNAEADAEVKMKVDFDAMMCYTDTGRLEASPGDRFTAHRMFENVANSGLKRKQAGIAPNTEKPYFFYNGTITAFGTPMAQVTKFRVGGTLNTQTMFTVGANPLREYRNSNGQSLEQVPFAGSRNPSLNVEGKVEYECDMEVIVTDPLLWHEFRSNRQQTHDNPITLHLVKNGAGPTREEVYIIVDDYIIQEAPLQIPDDKSPILSAMKILPKHIKVVAHDALFHC